VIFTSLGQAGAMFAPAWPLLLSNSSSPTTGQLGSISVDLSTLTI
jgi:hypothetical protein